MSHHDVTLFTRHVVKHVWLVANDQAALCQGLLPGAWEVADSLFQNNLASSTSDREDPIMVKRSFAKTLPPARIHSSRFGENGLQSLLPEAGWKGSEKKAGSGFVLFP
jgi:hypothetical protein